MLKAFEHNIMSERGTGPRPLFMVKLKLFQYFHVLVQNHGKETEACVTHLKDHSKEGLTKKKG